MEKRLYSLKEFGAYTGIGASKCRQLAREHESDFAIRVGTKLFIDIKGFESYMEKCRAFGIPIC